MELNDSIVITVKVINKSLFIQYLLVVSIILAKNSETGKKVNTNKLLLF